MIVYENTLSSFINDVVLNETSNKARMVAGYCYDRNVKNKRGEWDIILPDDFFAKWNLEGDDIWACASLLHIKRGELEEIIKNISNRCNIEIIEMYKSTDVRKDRNNEEWINMILKLL